MKDKHTRVGERANAGERGAVSDKVMEGSHGPHLITEISVVREWAMWLSGRRLFQEEV